MDFKIKAGTDKEGFRRIEYWIEQIAENYNLESSYYADLSVLFDALRNYCAQFTEAIEVELRVDDNGFTFETRFSQPRAINLSDNEAGSFLKQLTEQLCNSAAFGQNYLCFTLASESMPQTKVVARQQVLSKYLKGETITTKSYDKLSRP